MLISRKCSACILVYVSIIDREKLPDIVFFGQFRCSHIETWGSLPASEESVIGD